MTAITVLNDVQAALRTDKDPNGAAAYTALLVAAHLASRTATATTDRDEAASWDFCAMALHEALTELPPSHRDNVVLSAGEHILAGTDLDAVTERIAALIDQLTEIFAATDSNSRGSAAQRQTWTTVARRLELAAAEVP